jgi:hypothetical protein
MAKWADVTRPIGVQFPAVTIKEKIMQFEKYEKIRRLGDSENEGILKGLVHISEKLDGSNASLWYDSNLDKFVFGGRNGIKGFVILDEDGEYRNMADSFRGLGVWLAITLKHNPRLSEYLKSGENRIFGEWLVTHKVAYKPEFLQIFYAYDLEEDGVLLSITDAYLKLALIGIPMAPNFGAFTDPKVDELRELVGKSDMAITRGEGVVIKNFDFINKFGRKTHAKFVCEKFQEQNGGRVKKTHDYGDIDITCEALADGFVTEARIDKLIQKIKDETGEEGLSMVMIGRILGQHWQDMWNEEAHAIMKATGKHDFNFSRFKVIHNNRVKEIFAKMMDENI